MSASFRNGVESIASRRGDDVIAVQQHGRADADGDAADRGDHRLFALRQRVEELKHRRIEAGVGRVEKVGDIVAGAKDSGCAGEHHAADGVALIGLAQRSVMSAYIARVSAFFFSGRFIRMMRTAPSSVTAIAPVIVFPRFSPDTIDCASMRRSLAIGDDCQLPGRTAIRLCFVANELADGPKFAPRRRSRLRFDGPIEVDHPFADGVTTAPPPRAPPVSAFTAGSRSV
jgi:hypothetical protein